MAARTNDQIFGDTSLSLSQQVAESAANAKAAGIAPLTPQQAVAAARAAGTAAQSAFGKPAAAAPLTNTQLGALATSTPSAASSPAVPPAPTVSGTTSSVATSGTPAAVTPPPSPASPVTAALDPTRAALTQAAAPAPTAATPTPAPSAQQLASLTPAAGQLTGPQINALTAQANSVSHNADANLIAQGPAAVQALIDKLQAEGAAGTRNPSNVAASVAHLQAMLAIGGPTGRTKAEIFADPTTTNDQKLAEMALNATGPSAAAAAGVDPLTALRAAEGTSGASQSVLDALAAAGLPVATTQSNANPFTGANAPAGGVLNPPNAAVTPPGQPANTGVTQAPGLPSTPFLPPSQSGPAQNATTDQRPLAQSVANRPPVQLGHTLISADELDKLLGLARAQSPAAPTAPSVPVASPVPVPASSAPALPINAPLPGHPLSSLAQSTIAGVQFPTTSPFPAGTTSASLGRAPVEDDLANLLASIRTGTTQPVIAPRPLSTSIASLFPV